MWSNKEKKPWNNCVKPIQNEAKGLRATTFAIAKFELNGSKSGKK